MLSVRDFFFYDGGMGTMLQKNGLRPGAIPDIMNIEMPDVVERIHRMYVDAGSDIICTNTFGANRRKLKETGCSVSDVISSAVSIAKRAGAGKPLVALDIGPIGDLMQPMGILTFDDAYGMFSEQAIAGEKAGADLVAIETMSDLFELRAAILAVRENTSLPVFATMTFDKSGRTFTGCAPECFAVTATALGAFAIGINCSLSPDEIFPIAEKIAKYTHLPLIIKPNAGLPRGELSEYDIDPDKFARDMAQYASLGVKIVGGCCGTTPEYIRRLRDEFSGLSPLTHTPLSGKFICSQSKLINLDDIDFNPAPQSGSDDIVDFAVSQAYDGADIVTVYFPPSHDDVESNILEIQSLVSAPLYIVSEDAGVLCRAARVTNGVAALKYTGSGQFMHMDEVQKYGALLNYT